MNIDDALATMKPTDSIAAVTMSYPVYKDQNNRLFLLFGASYTEEEKNNPEVQSALRGAEKWCLINGFESTGTTHIIKQGDPMAFIQTEYTLNFIFPVWMMYLDN